MNQSDFQSSEDQKHGSTPSEVHQEAPDLLSRIMHVAFGLVQHVRKNPSLRTEVIQILRHLEQVITPPRLPSLTPHP